MEIIADLKNDKQLMSHIKALAQKENTPVHSTLSLFLDTATHYTGYAIYEAVSGGKVAALRGYGLFKGGGGEWPERCLEITSKVSNIIRTVKPGLCVMEYPTFQAGSRGMAAARSGGTLELAYLCGRISVAWETYITKVLADTGIGMRLSYLIPFTQWNGQLTKEITCHRCEQHFGLKIENAHSIENNFVDAIMLGKWFLEDQGMMLVNKGAKDAERIDF